VPGEEIPHPMDGDQASSKLDEGLKTCRTIVANYRAMIVEASEDHATDPPAVEVEHGDDAASTLHEIPSSEKG
jgi:hypothetical protein